MTDHTRFEALINGAKIPCRKLAVIFGALYALLFLMFCSNGCFSVENGDHVLEGVVCRG